jgi:WD40 repeat protein
MRILQNENLLRLILNNITLYETRLLYNKLENKTINKIILTLLNYDDIFRSIGKSKLTLAEECEQSESLTAVLPNGNLVFAKSQTVKAWDINNHTILNTLDVEVKIIYLAALPNNNVAVCLQDGTIKVWNTENYANTNKLKEYDYLKVALLLSNSNIACIAADVD